ncbi:MAG TPA: SAM-dependent methyltransferase [Cyanobacteria bacterium UBA11372]|nr:SAM-dependent methyltransferase [Cyanobacteria bacterium UBA11372]
MGTQLLKVATKAAIATSLLLAGCTEQAKPKQETTPPAANAPGTPTPKKVPDVVYVPTPQVVVDKMLEMAKVGKNDVLYDLGSGDGRIVITAAEKFGTKGTGIEIDPKLVKQATTNAEKAKVSDRVQFLEQDLFQTDISSATVVTLYLLPELNLRLRPTLLRTLKPGTRIVSHDFDMGIWKPERVERVKGPRREHIVGLWVVPEKVPPELLNVESELEQLRRLQTPTPQATP